MKFKQLLAGVAAALTTSGAMAGTLTGNVGVVSDYMFRGLDQSGAGAAVQGGVDYGFDFGAYSGLWVTNSSIGGGNEADVYAGWGTSFGQGDGPKLSVDAGLIYYAYTEDTEETLFQSHNFDYAEAYVGAGFGPLAVKVFYTNEFGGDTAAGSAGPNGSGDPGKNPMLYTTASATLTLTDTVSFTPEVGFTSGDGAKDAFGDQYTDYSLTATKKLKDDMSVSLAVVGTDLKNFNGKTDNKDDPKFVVGFKKNFKI
jgi:uncharacterized protein (TIGR02001 family)